MVIEDYIDKLIIHCLMPQMYFQNWLNSNATLSVMVIEDYIDKLIVHCLMFTSNRVTVRHDLP